MKTLFLTIFCLVLSNLINAQGEEKVHLDYPKITSKSCEEGDCENGKGKAKYELKVQLYPQYAAIYSGNFKDGKPNGEGWLFIRFPSSETTQILQGKEVRLEIASIEGVFNGFECDGYASYGTVSDEGTNEEYTYKYSGKTLLGVPQKYAIGKTLGSWKSTTEIIKISPAFAFPDSVKISYKDKGYYLGNSHFTHVGVPGGPGIYYGKEYKINFDSEFINEQDIQYDGEIIWNNNDTFNGRFKLNKYQYVNGGLEFIPVKGEIKYANGKTHNGEFDKYGKPKLSKEEDASGKLYKMAQRMFGSGKNEKGCALLKKAYQINNNNAEVNALMKSKCN